MFILPTETLVLVVLVTGSSGFFLKYCLGFDVTAANRIVPLASIVVGVILSFLLPNFGEAIIFFTAATAQFTAFVFVSRLRQRGSFFWHAVASLAANGTWYVTMHLFDGAGAYWMYIFPFVAGIIAGRTIGVLWAQYVEKAFDLKSDAARDPRLAPGKRLHLVAHEPTFWVLSSLLVIYVLYGLFSFESVLRDSLLIVVSLGILQNFFYALNTRAVQRGSNTYIALTGVLSGTVFYISAAYLFSKDLPLALLVPYMLSTALGSTMGAFFSMIIEWSARLSPDQHLEKKAVKQSRTPYVVIAVLALLWVLVNESVLNLFGYESRSLVFPLPIPGFDALPRVMIILAAAVVFFLDTALHAVTSRAGNRNHAGYHVSACIPKGLVDFSKMGYLALNSSIPDIIPIAVLASCLGSLFGKSVSERVEVWLKARMDVA